MSVPRLTRPSAQAQAPQRTGVAMAVILTGVLMTAVDTSRGLAFAIFVGSTSLHAAFYASMGFMALAAALSALRAGSAGVTRAKVTS